MDGVSEDFSGLPEYRSRRDRREERLEQRFQRHRTNPHGGRRTRILLVGGFVLALILLAVSLIAFFAPTPYLGTSYGALAKSVGATSEKGCHPGREGWVCVTDGGNSVARYEVRVDWAGCWTGELIGRASGASGAQPKITGCVSLVDHLRAG